MSVAWKNGAMTPNLSGAGIVDLGQIKAKQEAEKAVAKGATFVTDMTMANANDIINRSTRHVVVVEFWSAKAGAEAFSAQLAQLTNMNAGAWLLARCDVDDPDVIPIAQQFGVRAVPTVMAIVAGQVAPLFEGTTDMAQVQDAIAQVLDVAAQNGLTGRAEPVAPPEGAEQQADPRFAKADELIEAGDWNGARAEYDRLLNQYPGDADVLAGRASVGLLARNAAVTDAEGVLARADADPSDVDAALAAADIEMQVGREKEAYARLIGAVRETSGAERDRIRTRLLELFEVTGNTPDVLAARRDLMTALF